MLSIHNFELEEEKLVQIIQYHHIVSVLAFIQEAMEMSNCDQGDEIVTFY